MAKDSPHYARIFIEHLLRAPESLVEFPEMGRQVPEAGLTNLRELIVQGYRIIYQIGPGDSIVVLAIVHGRRRLTGEEVPERKTE
ncbi:MAG: type II toxin-antitoxin system RelE/ParE family toxin [Rhodospirillaceae bacterium]|nr:type II toxin-antitoxin system RelE/ParE family toxin [Rhodospirillaceae bacterium]